MQIYTKRRSKHLFKYAPDWLQRSASGYTTFLVLSSPFFVITVTLPGCVVLDSATYSCPWLNHSSLKSKPRAPPKEEPWDLLLVIPKHTRTGNWTLLNPSIGKLSSPGPHGIFGRQRISPLCTPMIDLRMRRLFVMRTTWYRAPFTCPFEMFKFRRSITM